MRLILTLCLLTAALCLRKPIFVNQYVSNGERAGNFINWKDHPEYTFMNADYPDHVQEMQMTPKGTLNIARLGAEFGEDFVDDREFFDEQYNQDEFIIRTLFTNSAFISAYAFLVGMYPDTTEGIYPDPRIDGKITLATEGTDEEVDHVREILDLPEVED